MSLPANWDPSRQNVDSMRAADADRDRAVALLQTAVAEGRLDWAEHEERLDRVMKAQTYGELSRLVADLPEGMPRRWGPPSPKPHEPLAIASLVLGILTPFTGVTVIPSIVLGHIALSKIKREGSEGRALAVAGLAISYVCIGLVVLATLFMIAVVGGMMGGFDG